MPPSGRLGANAKGAITRSGAVKTKAVSLSLSIAGTGPRIRNTAPAGSLKMPLRPLRFTFRLGYSCPRDILQGQIDEKCGALADVAFDTDSAGMCRDDLSRD